MGCGSFNEPLLVHLPQPLRHSLSLPLEKTISECVNRSQDHSTACVQCLNVYLKNWEAGGLLQLRAGAWDYGDSLLDWGFRTCYTLQ